MGSRNTPTAAAFLLVLFFASACSADKHGSLEDLIDPILAVPKGSEVQRMLFAVGQQMYRSNGSAWLQANVSADLFDFAGRKVGHHYYLGEPDALGGQPTWETFDPVPWSLVTGKKMEGVAQDGAVMWLLLNATNVEGDRLELGCTTFVQRIYTTGGLAPADESTSKYKLNHMVYSNYTAIYTFAAPSLR